MKAEFPPGSLPEGFAEQMVALDRSQPFSIFWEVRTLLYLGVVALTSGLGVLIYKHIDTIGHQALLAIIAALTAACFFYCAKRAQPFTRSRTTLASPWLDYVLLLGVLLLGIFVGYLQAQYSVFGDHYGLAVALPSLGYLLLAYRFDHRGVLQLGLAGLYTAVGVGITPQSVFQGDAFVPDRPVFAGLGMAALFTAVSVLSVRYDFKRHFSFSYVHLATHLSLIAALSGMFRSSGVGEMLYFLLIAGITVSLWFYARRHRSHYFLVCTVGYAYIAFTYVCMHILLRGLAYGGSSVIFLYVILSCVGTIYFFLNLKNFVGPENVGVSEK